jgi:carbon-monoxide dehydrogenase medium subunit
VYPHAFKYVRAGSLEEASTRLLEFGEDAKALAGGQSLIPLMKLRLSKPTALVDLNFIAGLGKIEKRGGRVKFGALARHAEIEESDEAREIPILHDCAAGIADVQVRNRGTIGGSLAEADPSGDWGAVLLALTTEVICVGPAGERRIALEEFFKDAYTTALGEGELVKEVEVEVPSGRSGGAYVAFKRCAPVYASASAAVQLRLGEAEECERARIFLGCAGLLPVRVTGAEAELQGKRIAERAVEKAMEAAREAADPQSDMRGPAEYKKLLAAELTGRAIRAAVRRCRGERAEVRHEYAVIA